VTKPYHGVVERVLRLFCVHWAWLQAPPTCPLTASRGKPQCLACAASSLSNLLGGLSVVAHYVSPPCRTDRRLFSVLSSSTSDELALEGSEHGGRRCSRSGHASTSVDADGHSSVCGCRRSRTAEEDGGSRLSWNARRQRRRQGLAASRVEFTWHHLCVLS